MRSNSLAPCANSSWCLRKLPTVAKSVCGAQQRREIESSVSPKHSGIFCSRLVWQATQSNKDHFDIAALSSKQGMHGAAMRRASWIACHRSMSASNLAKVFARLSKNVLFARNDKDTDSMPVHTDLSVRDAQETTTLDLKILRRQLLDRNPCS